MQTHRNLLAMTACYFTDLDAVTQHDAVVYAAPMSHAARMGNFAHVLKAVGALLAAHAIKEQGATKVDVNEQNEQAIGFYRHIGFSVTGRSPVDGQGKSNPLLHMAL